MKKAFTMIELVFVIVIVGILSAMIAPNFQRNSLREAADQVISHIRYTQHLAMMDDKYDPNDSKWFKGRWQMYFSKTTLGSDDKWTYSIFSDTGNYDGNPNKIELATNPLDATKYLTGGYSGTVQFDEPESTSELLLGKKYGILDIDFLGGCSAPINQQRIAFDYQGRLLYKNLGGSLPTSGLTSLYKRNNELRLVTTQCIVQLCLTSPCTSATNENKIEIAIEPETGYAHII